MNLNHWQDNLDIYLQQDFRQEITALIWAYNLLKVSITLIAQLSWVIYLTNFNFSVTFLYTWETDELKLRKDIYIYIIVK